MTANERPKLGAMLLAAGGSSRLGQPKQLLKLEGETLIRRAARSLADSVYFPVVVVVGAEADLTATELADLPVYHSVNEAWSEGMGSSIRSGLGTLLELEPALDGVLIALCDQPQITAGMLNTFARKFSENGVALIAASYSGVEGVPALFSKSLFGDLLELKGDTGARQIIRDRENVCTIELPEAATDVDTASDAAMLGITW